MLLLSSLTASRALTVTIGVQSLLVADTLATPTPTTTSRLLGGGDGDYMQDDQGNKYATYSMSWRYLGMYIDCDLPEKGDGTIDGVNRQRHLKDNKNNQCVRKVLWAAYHDPEYEGFAIGEYQFFDWSMNKWDNSTCQTTRCAKMDCHLTDSRYQLFGVYTETDGLEDWAEQLFKHEGYCVWDGDKEQSDDGDYNFMQNQRKTWSTNCKKSDVADANGSYMYIGVKPLPYGQMTFGLYTDESCTVDVAGTTYQDYMMSYYMNKKGYSSEVAAEYVEDVTASIQRWNNLMQDWISCQPCRAYNKVQMSRRQRQQRQLNNDGDGDKEMWGYDCYDVAGYTNCNQCYKFGAKTDMEAATVQDLTRATVQGSIMEIEVDGVMYGGYIEPYVYHFVAFSMSNPQVIFFFVALFVVFGIFFYAARRMLYNRCVKCCRKLRASTSLNEKLNNGEEDGTNDEIGEVTTKGCSDDGGSECHSNVDSEEAFVLAAAELLETVGDDAKKEKAKSLIETMSASISERDSKVEQLVFQLDMERTRSDLERTRLKERTMTLRSKVTDLAVRFRLMKSKNDRDDERFYTKELRDDEDELG